MSWNYRIVAVDYGDEVEYGIYEVYYDEKGDPISRTENPVPCVGNAMNELRSSFDYMAVALGMPVMTDADFRWGNSE